MTSNADVLFLGRLFPPVNEDNVRSKARVDMQDAANQLQWNLINGFKKNGIKNINVVSYLPVDSWPKHFKDAFVKQIDCNIYDVQFRSVGFCNITYIKQFLCKKICNKSVVEWVKNKNGRKKILFCYTCNNTLMRAVAAAKRANPDVVAVQIIADITEFAANDKAKGIKKQFIINEIKTNERLMKHIDGYVLLTKQMKEKLGINKPYIVMEGICPARETKETEGFYCNSQDVRTILYTGSMNKKYGICELLNAFLMIDNPNFRLQLCGLGNAEAEIIEACKKDGRIEFLGKVSHSRCIELQRKATVLVNPRQNNEEFTKYSFPSKNLEYLSTGKPLVAFKLDGIPDEYDEFINYVSDNTLEAFRDKLVDVCVDEDRSAKTKAENAMRFVLENKNYIVQSKKILDFISHT
ncbi:MAG: glycosyltransferase family 4 protein [Clostridia bacterium]|nr:glycosyltransferase family 4 protein [Clostridia bacterium]